VLGGGGVSISHPQASRAVVVVVVVVVMLLPLLFVSPHFFLFLPPQRTSRSCGGFI
jgi:hypothetical protein